MDHTTAKAADLAVDHNFIQWVKYPTSESNLYWKNFVMTYPEKEQVIAEARQLVLLLSQEDAESAAYDQDLQQIWQQLDAARRQDEDQEPDSGRVVSLLRIWQNKTWRMAAAAIALLLISSIVFFQLRNEPQLTYATNFGEKRTILLPDNSVIVLNSNSVVTIPEKWPTDEPRRVHLQGEAFFSVTHQANHQKFIVTTSEGTQIDVLGTEFNVYDRDRESKVVLASGKVCLLVGKGDKTSQLEMQPGDMISITADAGISRKQVRPALYTSWKDNKVYFDDYTLAEVATMLEHTYGQHIVFRDTALQAQRITAYLDVNGPDDILTTIAETFDVQIERRDDKIIINSL